MSLIEQQAPIDRAVVQALIGSLPDGCLSASMTVLRVDDGVDERMCLELSCLEPPGKPVMANEAIYTELYRLTDCFRQYGPVWRSVQYVVTSDDLGDWHYTVSFKYDQAPSIDAERREAV